MASMMSSTIKEDKMNQLNQIKSINGLTGNLYKLEELDSSLIQKGPYSNLKFDDSKVITEDLREFKNFSSIVKEQTMNSSSYEEFLSKEKRIIENHEVGIKKIVEEMPEIVSD